MNIPKVFISYSHDNLDHKKWVLELAIRMRNNGIDAIIDQWELKPGDDLPHFMETNLALADSILMICSEKYIEKANGGQGGVGYEKMIITSNLLSNIDENKVIPIIKQISTKQVPTFLKTKIYIDFSNSEDFEFSFDELIRTIHGSPLYIKPEIGNNPFKKDLNIKNIKAHDGLHELMKVVIHYYETTNKDYITYDELYYELKTSRILLDFLIDKAVSLGYIEMDPYKIMYLLQNGKQYAINNNLLVI